MLGAPSTLIAAALGDELTESEATVRIFVTAGGLAVLGFTLLLFTIWWWRGTKPEPPALGPLEVMGDRRWNTATDAERRRMIDFHRPAGSFELDGVVAPIPIDLSVLARELPTDFDDLREPVLALGPSFDAGPPTVDPEQAAVSVESVPSVDAELSVDAEPTVDAHSIENDPLIVGEFVLNGVQVTPVDAGRQPSVDTDATMYQVEAPVVPQKNAFGADHQQLDEPSDELVIDPLLQRTASQD